MPPARHRSPTPRSAPGCSANPNRPRADPGSRHCGCNSPGVRRSRRGPAGGRCPAPRLLRLLGRSPAPELGRRGGLAASVGRSRCRRRVRRLAPGPDIAPSGPGRRRGPPAAGPGRCSYAALSVDAPASGRCDRPPAGVDGSGARRRPGCCGVCAPPARPAAPPPPRR